MPPPMPPYTAPISWPMFSWMVMRVCPPRTETAISRSRRTAAPRAATHENERPN